MFVPRHYVQRDGDWVAVTAADARWLNAVYADAPLVTELLPDGLGRLSVVSSSTKPALMVRMLDALDVGDGHRVLEIGTGTGYNAALLCHRLGAESVFSVDIGVGLVAAARERLAALGYAPTLVAADGRFGLPGHGRFDRIVATCSVPTVPWAWAEQLTDGGLVLVDVKVGSQAGSLVLLRRYPDRLEGRFLARWAGFMPARDGDVAPSPPPGERAGPVAESVTFVDPDPWTALVPWFLASAGRSPVVGVTRYGPGLDGWRVSAADGSWSEVEPADARGLRVVRQGGPRRIWADVEDAHRVWAGAGRPGWERLGLVVTPDRKHGVWLDDPAAVLRTF
ncbi:methyltransferase domain-containing protein [Pseudonocardia aurantiaca]